MADTCAALEARAAAAERLRADADGLAAALQADLERVSRDLVASRDEARVLVAQLDEANTGLQGAERTAWERERELAGLREALVTARAAEDDARMWVASVEARAEAVAGRERMVDSVAQQAQVHCAWRQWPHARRMAATHILQLVGRLYFARAPLACSTGIEVM
jgi:hypothetical protein